MQEYNNPLSRFSLSTSFSILDWIIVDEAKTGNLEHRVNQKKWLQLVFNIFPEGQSILHKFTSSSKSDVTKQMRMT